ncbi:protein-tyrosine phosphatase-like protein [Xylariomycetidae sp. FL0641]|nr:protein-tyrosine phosphatase-like protein [Xylariomycetidae sp. FL0641]
MAEEDIYPSPPFLPVEGVRNFRDIGGYPVVVAGGTPSPPSSCSSSSPAARSMVRRGLVYRSGNPSKATPAGVATLKLLGIEKIFDLRSTQEFAHLGRDGRYDWLVDDDGGGGGVERVFLPVFRDRDYQPEAIALRNANYGSGSVSGFVDAYKTIMNGGVAADNPAHPFRTILRHLATAATPPPPPPALIHCSAGKDRTGVVVGLLLALLGVEDEVVAHEYSLTDLGLRDIHQAMIVSLTADPLFKDNPMKAKQMIRSKKSYMQGFLQDVRERYGSIEDCILRLGLLTRDEVRQLRDNMVVEATEEEMVDWKLNAEVVVSEGFWQ